MADQHLSEPEYALGSIRSNAAALGSIRSGAAALGSIRSSSLSSCCAFRINTGQYWWQSAASAVAQSILVSLIVAFVLVAISVQARMVPPLSVMATFGLVVIGSNSIAAKQ